MLFQSTDPLGALKTPSENQVHSWRNVEVQNLKKRTDRYGHTSTILDDHMIVIGGATTEAVTREELTCLSFNLKTQVCDQIPVTGRDKKPILNHSTCHWKDNKFIVFGGCGRDERPFSELGILTLSERNTGNSQ